jgi:hypothetical protein
VNITRETYLIAVVPEPTPPGKNNTTRFFAAADMVGGAQLVRPDRGID